MSPSSAAENYVIVFMPSIMLCGSVIRLCLFKRSKVEQLARTSHPDHYLVSSQTQDGATLNNSSKYKKPFLHNQLLFVEILQDLGSRIIPFSADEGSRFIVFV
ncbi:hypothetical protein CDAR_561611 [Caerostris darwini]|uniref:Uncharacterized protein n=1 Tax=Caerostris darwini TaxID=1538125 RepID=A0AAV4MJQ5_9ARAC|nr:hypothetical protein CDAR_561611 [Caerostris darwini]